MDPVEANIKTAGKRFYLWHPILFGLYPVVALYALNRAELAVSELLRPAVVSILISLLVWGIMGAIAQDMKKGALLASIAIVGSYVCWGAFVKNALYAMGEWADVKIRYLALGYAAVLGVFWVIAFLSRTRLPAINRAMNAVSAILIGMAAVQAAASIARNEGAVPPAQSLDFPDPVVPIPADIPSRPNVFFLVLDSYARADVLQKIFQFDNEPFLSRMRARGFFVAEQSHVNYTHTVESLPACLNMDYLENLGYDPDAPDYGGVDVGRLFHYSKVHAMFRHLGYRMAAVSTGFRFTEPLDYYDYVVRYQDPWWEPTLFEIKLLDFSPALRLFRYAGVDFGHNNWRRQLLYTMEHLNDPLLESPQSPWFVFAHILAPHAPFVFRADGSPSPASGVLSLSSGADPSESYEVYKRLYVEQVSGLNVHIEQTVDAILNTSPQPPVIAIVSDHGPKLENVYPEGLKHSLFMLYLPGVDAALLQHDVNLVDLFPTIFRHIFSLPVEDPPSPVK
ncbi:MAG: hypothetical protein AMXMBFR84_29880 [Candidatus Hydrogenedentota bacterium]